jgi:predicted HicB family RNase H-like nuclease
MEILKYKEFEGSAEVDVKRGMCRGKILHIDDVVTYESKEVRCLQEEFESAVNDYIETCKLVGKEPQKPCRGQFNVRVSPELHRAAVVRSILEDTSLNDVVRKALDAYLAPTANTAFVLAQSAQTSATKTPVSNVAQLGTVLVHAFDPTSSALFLTQGELGTPASGAPIYRTTAGAAVNPSQLH